MDRNLDHAYKLGQHLARDEKTASAASSTGSKLVGELGPMGVDMLDELAQRTPGLSSMLARGAASVATGNEILSRAIIEAYNSEAAAAAALRAKKLMEAAKDKAIASRAADALRKRGLIKSSSVSRLGKSLVRGTGTAVGALGSNVVAPLTTLGTVGLSSALGAMYGSGKMGRLGLSLPESIQAYSMLGKAGEPSAYLAYKSGLLSETGLHLGGLGGLAASLVPAAYLGYGIQRGSRGIERLLKKSVK